MSGAAAAETLELEGVTAELAEQASPRDQLLREYALSYELARRSILSALDSTLDLVDPRNNSVSPELATSVAQSVAWACVQQEKAESLPAKTPLSLKKREVANLTSVLAGTMPEVSRKENVRAASSDVIHEQMGGGPKTYSLLRKPNGSVHILEKDVFTPGRLDKLEASVVDTLTSIHARRFAQVNWDRPDVRRQFNSYLDRIIKDPKTAGSRFSRMAEAIGRMDLSSRVANGRVSKRLDAVTTGNADIDYTAFKSRLAKGTLRGQIDVLTYALGGVSQRDIEEFPQRVEETRKWAATLAKDLGVSEDALPNVVKTWEQAVSKLFNSDGERQLYEDFSPRERATVLALALQNGLGVREKIERIFQDGQSAEVIQLLTTLDHKGEAFWGWQDASQIASVVAKAAQDQVVSQFKFFERRTIGGALKPHREMGGFDPREPKNTIWPLVLIASTVVLSACAGLTSTPDTSNQPTPDMPTSTPASVIPTITDIPPTPQVLVGASSMDEVLAVAGIPAGFGGAGALERILNSQVIQDEVYSLGWKLVYTQIDGQNVISQELQQDGTVLCVFNLPQQIFDVNTNGGLDVLDQVGIESGIAHYGVPGTNDLRLDALTAVDISGLPDNYSCVSAIVYDQARPDYTALQVLLIDETTGEVHGWMPAVYARGDNLQFAFTSDGHPAIRANGEAVHFQEFASTVATPESSPTPEFTRLYEGVPPTIENWPHLESVDQIPERVQYWLAEVRAHPIFEADTGSVLIGLNGDGQMTLANPATNFGSQDAIQNLESFSIIDPSTGTQHFFVIRAFNNAGNTDDPNEQVVVWATWIGENPFFGNVNDAARNLGYINDSGGQQELRVFTQSDVNTQVIAPYIDPWFADSEYAAFLARMYEEGGIYNIDKPLMTRPIQPYHP